MTGSSEATVREIQEDLACPACEYNLRGLRGDVVACPECGAKADIARLVTQRWTKPWYRAPGLNHLMFPVAWLVGGLIGTLVLAVLLESIGLVVGLITLSLGWGWLMYRVGRRLPAIEGLGLALLAHVVFLGYLVGTWGILGAGIGLVVGAIGGQIQPPWNVTTSILTIGVLVSLLWVCRQGERFMAKRCIRHHLRRIAVPTPE